MKNWILELMMQNSLLNSIIAWNILWITENISKVKSLKLEHLKMMIMNEIYLFYI